MQDCIFCKIAGKEIPSEIVYEDEKIIAFKDLNPVAPTHILLIPKKHIGSAMDLQAEDQDILIDIFLTAQKLAVQFGMDEKGFRIVNNCLEWGGQSVPHLHFHLIGGRQLQWPPG